MHEQSIPGALSVSAVVGSGGTIARGILGVAAHLLLAGGGVETIKC